MPILLGNTRLQTAGAPPPSRQFTPNIDGRTGGIIGPGPNYGEGYRASSTVTRGEKITRTQEYIRPGVMHTVSRDSAGNKIIGWLNPQSFDDTPEGRAEAIMAEERRRKNNRKFNTTVLAISAAMVTGGAAYATFAGAGVAGASGGVISGSAGAPVVGGGVTAGGLGGAAGVVGKTTVLAGTGLGGGTAAAVATKGALAITGTTLAKYAGTAIRLLTGSAKSQPAPNDSTSFSEGDVNDYSTQYGSGGGSLGSGGMTTEFSESEKPLWKNPIILFGAFFLLVAGFIYMKR